MCVRWYPYLVSSRSADDPSEPSQASRRVALLDRETVGPRHLVVCQELERRSFARFDSYLSFAAYAWQNVQPSHQCFYEVIFSPQPQKVYFDLDLPLTPVPGVPLDVAATLPGVPRLRHPEAPSSGENPRQKRTYSLEDSAIAIDRLLHLLRSHLPMIQPRDILVFNSNSDRKHSYHVIVDRWCCPDASEIRAFCERLVEAYPENLRPIIDTSMYKSIQLFRLYRSHKWGSSRTKVLDPHSTWEPDTPPETDGEAWTQLLGASLIGNASYCRVLPSFKPPEKPRPAFSGFDLSGEEVQAMLEACARAGGMESVSPSFPYRVGEVRGSMVLLRRQRPSFCRLCSRTHDAENPFLTVTSDRRIWFHCRRAPHGRRLPLGVLSVRPDPSSPPTGSDTVESGGSELSATTGGGFTAERKVSIATGEGFTAEREASVPRRDIPPVQTELAGLDLVRMTEKWGRPPSQAGPTTSTIAQIYSLYPL